MEPTIEPKSFIINWRFPFLVGDPIPNHGDIVVFKPGGQDRRLLVKRVIGLPGDQISFEGGYVFRNGEKLDEPYLQTEGVTYSDTKRFSVPDGCIFCHGGQQTAFQGLEVYGEPLYTGQEHPGKRTGEFPDEPAEMVLLITTQQG